MSMEKELLRKQMELLAEQSKGATDRELAELSSAISEIYDRLRSKVFNFLAVLLSLVAFPLSAASGH